MGKESFREVGILLGHDICLKENSRWFGLRAFDWNLILTSQGSCSVSSGQEFSCEMEFGSLTLFPPGAPRNYRIKEEWSCYWCHFVTGMVVQWPKLPGGCYQLRPSPELFEVMKQTMIEALELYRTSPRGWHLLAAHLVEGIILRGNLNVGNAEMPPEIARAQSLLDAAEFHFTDMEELARKCGLSRSVFFRKFREQTGTSPQHYRERRILRQAASLLETTDLTLAEIAVRTGFSDLYYFSRRFKNIYGISPGQYRQRIRLSSSEDQRNQLPPALI